MPSANARIAPARGVAIAAATFAVAAVATFAFWDAVFHRVPFALYIVAVAVAALVVRWWAGLAVAVAGVGTLLAHQGFDPALYGPSFILLAVSSLVSLLVATRGRALRAMAEAEQRYRAVFESSRDAKIIYAPDGTIVDANPAACELYGYKRAELVGVHAPSVVHPDALPMFREFQRACGAGGDFRCETVDRRRDGSTFDVDVRGTRLMLAGRPHLMSVIRDVSERKRAEAALARTNDRVARLYAVSAALADARTTADVARVAVEECLRAVGGSAGSLALRTPDGASLELVGVDGYPRDVVDRWRRFAVDAPIPLADAARLARPIYLDSPEERLRRYPALADVRATAATKASASVPLLVGDRAIGVLGISFDRDGPIASEDRAFVESLARQCAQAVERARLFEAERAARLDAERASQLKDEFLATLSHELRTPLNAILGWSQLVRRPNTVPADVAQGLVVIERNARAQAQIIDDLLDMSRIISGKVRIDVRPIDLPAIVDAAIETARPAAEAKGIRLVADVDPLDAIAAAGDASRLQQVLWNLLTNAIKFTPTGGEVRVALARVDANLELAVSDTGQGIAAEFLPFVFDRFRQADASTTRRHGGLGLGLSIAKHLVELHGGTVRVASDGEGRGATFVVSLPLTPTPRGAGADARKPEARQTPDATAVGAALAGATALVVDDEPDALALVRRLLQDRGATVFTAGSADEAMRLLAARRFDVLVSDVAMPDADGHSLVRRLRALGPTGGGATPAVALTAYARAEDRARSLAAGFQAHVAKPVEAAELVAVVAAVLARAPAAVTAAPGEGTP